VTRYLYPVAEACPACDRIEGVELTSTTARVEAWRCTLCGTSWAISVVNPHPCDRQAGAAHWILQQVAQLADDMSKLTDVELRDRLLALTESAR
jgi:transposase-like protein